MNLYDPPPTPSPERQTSSAQAVVHPDGDLSRAASGAGSAADGPPAARALHPRGSAGLSLLGVVLAILVIGLGVVAIHDAAVAAGWLDGPAWVAEAAAWVGALTRSLATALLSLLALAVGLWLLAASLRPRPRSAVPLRAQSLVYVTSGDAARLAVQAADRVDGVLDARVSGSPKALTVRVQTTGSKEVDQRVQGAVQRSLAAFEAPPSVTVRSTRRTS